MQAFAVPSLLLSRALKNPTHRCCVKTNIKHSCRRRLRASLSQPEAHDALLKSLRVENQPQQILALISLSRLPSTLAVEVLRSSGVLQSTNRQVRLTAVATLGKLGVTVEAYTLISVLCNTEDDYSVRAAAANALGSLLSPVAEDRHDEFVEAAVAALAQAAKEDENFIVRYAALVSLGNLEDRAALKTVIPIARDVSSPPLEAAAAVTALGEILPAMDVEEDVFSTVINRAGDREDFVRAAVARTLGKWNGSRAASVLERMQINEAKYGQSEMVKAVLSEVFGENNAT